MALSWDEIWMTTAAVVAQRSRCVRAQVGAVVVSPTNRILATGYNGPPAGLTDSMPPSCEGWCMRSKAVNPGPSYHDCLTVHAEVNALLYCDRTAREGGTVYVSGGVCWDCAKIVANSGVKRCVFAIHAGQEHRGIERSTTLMQRSGLEVAVW